MPTKTRARARSGGDGEKHLFDFLFFLCSAAEKFLQ